MMIGQTLSHYRIISALGAGGMGEVYRATDTNLNRDVAIKVLPPEVRDDAERLARFRREARVLASLSHPYIASIYGLEEADGQPFLAMELVEGEDLQQRLARGSIPVDEVLELAEQVAEALEEAHAKGVVHRDLKPANVKLTPDGKVKVLDFGLAKALDPTTGIDGADMAVSQSPTITTPAMTQVGMILGTAAYMSPEQARGRPVDKRADIWAFGVLVWEMLTGRALFSGDTVTDVIAAVVTKVPDLDLLPPSTPPAVRRLLERCLRKDPRQRLPDIGAARLELQDALGGIGAEAGPALFAGAEGASVAGGRRTVPWAWAAPALVLALASVVLAVVHFGEVSPSVPPVGRFSLELPDGWVLHSWGWPSVAPDGRRVAFRAVPVGATNPDTSANLWVRSLDAIGAMVVPETEGATLPFWSPDGQHLGYFRQEGLHRYEFATGTTRRITGLPGSQVAGADWGADGRILYSVGVSEPDTLYLVPATGGEPQQVRAAVDGVFAAPQWLEDDRFGSIMTSAGQPPGFYVASVNDPNTQQRVLDGFMRADYARGRLFFMQGSTLLAQPLDVAGAALNGEPTVMADPVASWDQNPGIGWYDVSAGGTLVYQTGQVTTGDVQLTWFDRNGRAAGTLGAPGSYGQIALSPDGRNVAVELQDPDTGYDLWVLDVARGVASRVTAGTGDERNPVWAPDGRSLIFSAESGDDADLRQKGLRAGDPETVLVDTDERDYPEAWSHDGRDLLFIRGEGYGTDAARQSIWTLRPGSGDEPKPLLDFGFFVDEPQVSPDGRWLTYTSQESGQSEVYIEPYGSTGERVRVSVDGGGQPKWRGDGGELFFTNLTGLVMSVAVRPGDGRMDVELPVELFQIGGFQGPDYDDYAPAADGSRFLVKLPLDPAQPMRMHVMTNWPSLVE